MSVDHSVIVVGAGVSGLYAAQLLKPRFPDVLIVEAQDKVGGRIKQLHGLAPWPIEAGPEFIHGRTHPFTALAQQMGAVFTEKSWPEWWYFGKEKQLMHDEQVGDEVNRVHELFNEDVGDEEPPRAGTDVSAAEWLRSKGASPKMLAVADACYANDFCAELKDVGLREMITENQNWDSGETYLIMDRSMGAIIEGLAQGLNIRTGCPVTRIEYGSSAGQAPVTLHCQGGRQLTCRAVLVTVPLRILQDKVLTFSPPLPAPKATAISRIRMGNAVKIVVSFRTRFWRDDMYDVVCPDCFVPEFWMLRYPASSPSAASQPGQHCVVGFVAGARADALSDQPHDQVVGKFLAQLDEIFKAPGNPTPASSSVVDARVVDWSKEQWVRGAYTYPTLGVEEGDREALAAPIDGRVFWAGEAVNTALNPCVQGAMASAQRAAVDISLTLMPSKTMELPKSKL